ncbi:MAG: hypothetical protein AAB839_03045 [Patescibacteria group bacterium]
MARSIEDAAARSRQMAEDPRFARPEAAKKGPEKAEDVILEASETEIERAADQTPAEQEGYAEAGERKVAEVKAAAEQRFGGFFAGVRSRMESIKSRAMKALYGVVGAGMEAGTVARKTGEGFVEVARSMPEAAANMAGFVYDDLVEPVFVDPAKAVGRGLKGAAEIGVGLGIMGATGAGRAAIEGGRRAAEAGRNAKDRGVEMAQNALKEVEENIASAKTAVEKAKGGAKIVAENALRSLEAKRLDLNIRTGELKADASLKVEQMVDVVKGGYAQGKEALAARVEQINGALDNAKELARTATGATKDAAVYAVRILEMRKLDAELSTKEALASAREKGAAAGRATARGARAVGRGAATAGAAGVGATILVVQGGYELGRRGVAGTIAGAEAVGDRMREVSAKGKERYDATMEALNGKLENAVGFYEKMRVRLEIAKTKFRQGLNEAYKALVTDEMREENAELVDGVEDAIQTLTEVDYVVVEDQREAAVVA